MDQEGQGQNWSDSDSDGGGGGRRRRGPGRPRKGAGIVPLDKLTEKTRIEAPRRKAAASAVARKKRLPMRGAGIEKLEERRMKLKNEQRIKEAAAAAAAAISPIPPSPSISHLPQQFPDFHHPNNQPSTLHHVPLQNSTGGVSTNFPYESNSPSNWTPRTQQCLHPFSSKVNVPSGYSTRHLVYYSKREPPSNPNIISSVPVMVMPVYKPVIIKNRSKSCPFCMGVPLPPASSFDFALPAFTTNMEVNQSALRPYGTGLNMGGNSSTVREVPSSSLEPSSKKNESLKRDFLTLALPIPPSTFPASGNQELPPPSQDRTTPLIFTEARTEEEDQVRGHQKQPFFNFFPTKEEEAQSLQTTKTNEDGNCNG